jgi:hypothetical protein
MAACSFKVLRNFLWFLLFLSYSGPKFHNLKQSKYLLNGLGSGFATATDFDLGFSRLKCIQFCCQLRRVAIQSIYNISLPVYKSSKRGLLCLSLPHHLFWIDLTIYMDIQRNPGPSIHNFRSIAQQRSSAPYSNLTTKLSNRFNYSRSQLFCLKSKYHVSPDVFLTLKNLGILNTRRNRAGRQHYSSKLRAIPSFITPRITSFSSNMNYRGINSTNLSIPLRLPLTPQVSQSAKLCLLNSRSVCNKATIINDFVFESNIVFLCLT